MSKKATMYILLGAVALITVLFYQVVSPFVFPLLFAAVLTVLFEPVNSWITLKVKGKKRLAAGLTTGLVSLLIILPLAGALLVAGIQMVDASQYAIEAFQPMEAGPEGEKEDPAWKDSPIVIKATELYGQLPQDKRERLQAAAMTTLQNVAKQMSGQALGLIGNLVGFGIGFVIMMLALFYFQADGDKVLSQVRRFSPLDIKEEEELIDQFEKLCRGIIMGSVLSALAQAVAAGIGFAVAGVPNALLLTVLTMVCSFIPFLGAGIVCISVCVYLAVNGQYVAAGVLLAYSLGFVSMIDNVIKAYVIGETVRLNPLVIFMTVIGAIQLIGLWGIFVGPMIAAFFFSFLHILHERLVKKDDGGNQEEDGPAPSESQAT